jgi:DNA-binding transcriptional LysR family regulator
LISRRVGTVGIGLFASRRYLAERGVPQDDFAGHDMVLFDETLAGMPGVEWVEAQARPSRIVMRSNEILPVVAATKAGLGIGIMPAVMAHGEPDLVPVAPGIVGRPEIFLMTHRDLRRRARVRVVFDFIVRTCTERAAALSGRAVAEAFSDHPHAGVLSAANAPRPPDPPAALSGSSRE